MVEFTALDAVDLTDYRETHVPTVYGTLGLVNVDRDVFICIITGAAKVATVRPRETVQRITAVEFCLCNFPFTSWPDSFTDPQNRLSEQRRL